MIKPKSQTLFHFTKSRDNLQLILKNGFWPRYCLEDLSWFGLDETNFVAFPMVCFCDIPLSRINDHVGFYGEFGIGLSREWALKNGLNPILYIAGENSISSAIQQLAEIGTQISSETERKSFIKHFRHLSGYIKPAEGKMVIAGSPVHKAFYQESEWRFIPTNDEIRDYLTKNDFDKIPTRDSENSKTKEKSILRFSPSDTKYIFVQHDSDIPHIINFIQNEMDHYPAADLKILMSRVISLETVRRDF